MYDRQHKLYIMGVTSLWLVIPILFGACADPAQQTVHSALMLWTVVVCAISTATYWFIGKGSPAPSVWREGCGRGKVVQFADKLCAPLMFVVLVAFFAAGFGPRPLSCWITLGAIPGTVAIFFLGSRFFELIRPYAAAATCCHLSFRYVGYWWVYLALTPPTVERSASLRRSGLGSLLGPHWLQRLAHWPARLGIPVDRRLHSRLPRGACTRVALVIAHRATTPTGEICALV